MLKKTAVAMALAALFSCFASAESVQNSPNLDVIDAPTANTLLRGMYNFHLRFYEGGGVITRAWVGFANIFMVGATFNTQNVIGMGTVTAKEPKVLAKIKIIEDSAVFPSLAFGYEPQEYGLTARPMGIYGVVTKTLLGNLVVDGGIYNHNVVTNFNFSDDFGVFAGGIWQVGQDFAFLVDCTDILQTSSLSLNFGIRYAFAPELRLEMDFKGLTKDPSLCVRNLRIDYVNYF
jgi:hypothetical protein